MWLFKKNIGCCIARLCILLCLSHSVLAQKGASKPADVRLLLDVSGSMKKNDPSNLRQSSIALLMQLLPEGSKAGVWLFSSNTTPLMPHGTVDTAWKKRATQAASNIDSKGLLTNIGGALEDASFEGGDQYNKSIILLTDGMVDIDKDPDINKEEWQRISSDVLDDVKSKGFVIHTVSLSDNADKQLMEALSLNTDGLAQVAKNADQLLKAFLKTFDAAVPTDQVPISGDEFSVDSSVEEFTALIFKKTSQVQPSALVSPDGSMYSAKKKASFINWYEGDNYDLITVKRPLEGTWIIKANLDNDSRVTIVSNLSLGVETLPNNAYLGHKQIVSSTLNEDGKPITRSAFLKLMRVKATLKSGDTLDALTEVWSEDWPLNRAPRGGKFEFQLPAMDNIGFYEITLHLDGRTFQRAFTHRLTVRQAYSTTLEQTSKDTQQHTVTVIPHTPTIDTAKTSVELSITHPSTVETKQPLTLMANGHWQAQVIPDQKGVYALALEVNEMNKSGKQSRITLDSLTFTSTIEPVENAEETPKEEILPEPDSALPMWLIYTLIGVGNLIFFGGLFFVIRKLLGKKDSESDLDDITGGDTKKNTDDGEPSVNGADNEPQSLVVDNNAKDDDDEEPPMEDLSPVEEPVENNDIELSEDIENITDNNDTVSNDAQVEAVSESTPEVATENPDDVSTVEQPAEADTNSSLEDIDPENSSQASEQSGVEPNNVASDEVDIDAIMAQQAEGTLDETPASSSKTQEEDIDDAINDLLNELENDDETK